MRLTKIIFAAILIMIYANNITASGKAKIGEKAPEFSGTGSDGQYYSLEGYSGKFVVLEWNNFDCPFVKKHYESKNMQQLQKKYTEKDVIWLTINSSAAGKQGHFPPYKINKKIKEYDAKMTGYLLDDSGNIGKKYDAKTTPHMYIINPDGILIYAGGIDDIASTDIADIKKATNYVSEALDSALAGKEVKLKTSQPYGCSVKY